MLHATAHAVTGVTHSPESALRLAADKRYTVLACDVSDESSVQMLDRNLQSTPIAILHCASSGRGGAEMYRKVYLEGCRHLLSVFPGAHLCFTSSTSVYPQIDGSEVTEMSDATPDRDTSRLLRETEDLVLAHGGSVARLAGIYGPGRSFVLKNFLEGKATIEGNDGEGRYLNQIHREDAAAALAWLMVRREAGIYNVADDCPMTQRECYAGLCSRFDRTMPPVAEPNTQRKRAWTHKRVSNARLRSTGWSPRYESYFVALDHDPALVSSILAQAGMLSDA